MNLLESEKNVFPFKGLRSDESTGRLDLMPEVLAAVRHCLHLPDRRLVGQQREVLGDPEQRTDSPEDPAEHAGTFWFVQVIGSSSILTKS